MNRNNERHFNNIPQMKTSRSRFKMKQDIKLTLNAGKLIPFYIAETLPGDTFSVDTKGICRMSTPIYPVMDNCYLDIYYFHVPMRIVWDHAKEFFGENNDSAWVQKTEYTIPKVRIGDKKNEAGAVRDMPDENTICDYLGIPTKVIKKGTKDEIKVNALPFRAYVKIWQEWFRDQNVDNPAINKTDDAEENYQRGEESDSNTILKNAHVGGYPLWVNKFHDRFTSALPYPQKGEATLIPMSGNAIVGYGSAGSKKLYNDNDFSTLGWKNTPTGWKHDANGIGANTIITKNNGNVAAIGTYPTGSGATESVNLIADLSNVESATINNLRQAFAVQQFMEADSRGGTRYREIIRSHFGVDIDDKTVQIPEYLGGQRYMINVNQVVQTSATDQTSPQGNAAAISVTPFMENSFTKSFQEHGYVIGVCCIRNDNTYQQGIEKLWSRTEKFDFYWPEFAHLGEQAILNKEIYAQGTADDEKAFGYQEAYSEYRMVPNRVCGKFRSNAEQPLDAWHYADNYSKLPTLSQEWLATDKSVIDRTIAVQNQPQFIMDVLVENDAVRPMPIYGTPGLTKL
nr:MAG TPA: Major capsid protein [Microviridae sp.]